MRITRREGLTGAAALAALAFVGRVAPALAADDNLSFVDPELRDAARQIRRDMAVRPPLSRATLAGDRRDWAASAPKPLADVPWEARRVPGSTGAPEVTVYLINARPGANRPAILHTHGGGYVSGSARQEINFCQQIARDVECTIVSVEYRLAPETDWRGSVEDNYAALLWVYHNAAAIGVDPKRIAVMGESAGGGHAALLALAARDRGEVPLVLQLLIYPMLDDRTASSRGVPPDVGTLVWNGAANRFGWSSFLGMPPGGTDVPAAAVPARREDLAGLPPTYVAVGGIDLFVQEDIAFAERLTAAGVPVELHAIPGAFHGFEAIAPEAGISQRFKAARLAALRGEFG
ncbi:alpha/beta hydrolase [Sphingomonas sp. ID0503]|uniref:alpha/beta hydrolase n=1 Tax=Sphingomonas sp. ID0503 TaxID=3399691 RepID=UPI003AFAE8BD